MRNTDAFQDMKQEFDVNSREDKEIKIPRLADSQCVTLRRQVIKQTKSSVALTKHRAEMQALFDQQVQLIERQIANFVADLVSWTLARPNTCLVSD